MRKYNNRVKKFIAALCSAAMFVTMLPVPAVSAQNISTEASLLSGVNVLAANVYYKDSGKNAYTPYIIKEVKVGNKVCKVGILGIENTDCSRFDVPDNYPNLVFAHPDNKDLSIAWEVNRYKEELKAKGCDAIIVSYHAGLGTTDGDLKFEENTENQVARMINETNGIDMVVAGHDHSTAYSNTYVNNKDGNGVLVVNGGGQQLTQSIFTVKYVDGKFVLGIKDSRNLDLSKYADDMQLANMLKPAVDDASAYVNQECGEIKGEKWSKSTDFYLEQTDSMDLINRAQMAIADKYLNATGDNRVKVSSTSVVVANNYVVQPGKISLKDIYGLYKFDNYLYIVPLTGKEIKTWMEGVAEDHFSYTFKNGKVKFQTAGNSFTNPVFYGLDFKYDLAKDKGSRVVGLKFADGSEVKDDATYNVAVNSYHIGQDPFTRTGKTTENAIWSSKDSLGDDGGTVQSLIAEFIKDSTAGEDKGVYPKPSNWGLTYSGEIPAEEVKQAEPTEVYDPISDDTIKNNGSINIKEASEKNNGEGSVIGQVVYKYNKNASIILEDVVNGQIVGYQVYDKEKAGKFEVGDIVKVTGTFGENYGVPQIVYGSSEIIEDLDESFAIAPQVVSVEDLGEEYMNEYVQIRNASIGASDGSYMKVTDATGDIQIYAGPATSLAGSKEKADINAVCSYYSRSSLYQLRVASDSDYQKHVVLYDPITDDMVREGVSTITEAKKADSDVTVIGQVAYRYSGSNGAEGARNTVILQDVVGGEVEGLQIYAKGMEDKFAVGDVVEVTGKMGNYGGVPQVTPSKVTRVAVKMNFAPQDVSISKLSDDYLSEYVRIADCTLGSYNGSGNTNIKDATGAINIYKGAAYPNDLDTGDKADVLGICSAYNDTFQMRIGKSSDYVKKVTAGGDAADDEALLRIPVYETSDVHGNLVDTSSGNAATYQYRLAYLGGLVEADRKDGDVLLLDGGDIYQGTPVSNLSFGQPMIAAYDDMKYDAVAIGNHEFDWEVTKLIDDDGTMGKYEITSDIKGDSQIPVVCSNIYNAASNDRVNFTRDYTIVEKTAKSKSGKEQKVRVAILGYADDFSKDIMAEKIAPYKIKENVKTLETKAKEIKETEKADAVVLLTHSGASGMAGSLEKGSAIDLVLGGHTHKDTAGIADNGVAYAQPKNAAQSYAYAELCIDPATNKVSVKNHEVKSVIGSKEALYDTDANKDSLDKEVMTISKAAVEKVSGTLNAAIGTVSTEITKDLIPHSYSSIAGNWLADLQCRATDSKVGFINNGGIRTSFMMPEGKNERMITKGDIYTIAPFNNQLYVYEMNYEKLKDVFEYALETENSLGLRMSGATVYSTEGKVTTIILDGEMIYDNGTWCKEKSTVLRVVTNNYVGTSSGTPFASMNPVETSAVDNESFINVLEQEAASNNGKLTVNTNPLMIEGTYDAASSISVASVDAEETAEFVVLTTTDMHGKCWNTNILTEAAVNNSFLRVATAVKEIRNQYGKDNVILIDNGDLFQGTQISSYNIAKGGINNPMAVCLKYIGYDVAVLGNHEFNFNYKTMQSVFEFLQDGLAADKPSTPETPENPDTPTPPPVVTPPVVAKQEISKATVAKIKDATYTGKEIKPSVTVKVNDKTLRNGVDYKLTYKNNVKAGTASVVIQGINDYQGSKTVTFKINKKSVTKLSVAKVKNQSYTGKSVKPALNVKDGKTTLRAGKDYTVSYKNNKKIGKATITLSGKGNYTGTKKITFNIVPRKPSIQKAKAYTRTTAHVTWKKVPGATGYQVKYATKKNGTYKSAGSTTRSTLTVRGLRHKRTYYVKVRAYKIVSGKRVYSEYSTIKVVKTR